MRKIFNGCALLLAASLWMTGCSKPAATSPAQVYTIYKHKVSLAPPQDWKVRQEPSPDNKEEVAAVVFEPPQGKWHLAVTITEGVKQDQAFMDRLGNGIRARKGTIVKQWYEHKLDDPDTKNAYFMEFDLQDAGPENPHRKGMQVQIFTQKGVLYSLVFQAVPEVYDANRSTFLAMVKSFQLAP